MWMQKGSETTWGRWWEGDGSHFPPRETDVACDLLKTTVLIWASVFLGDWAPACELEHLFRESRKLCFTVDRNLKAATIYSTRKPLRPLKEPQTLCFNHLQLLDKPHLLAGISLGSYLEETPWNRSHVAHAVCKRRCGLGQLWEGACKLPAFSLELG